MPFDSPDVPLAQLLSDAEAGKIQLPDFQREWKWDTDRIASLLASVSLGHPIGVLMTLEVGGEGIRFKPRPVAGAKPTALEPERLLLDGQQRITSLFQSLGRNEPVDTLDTRGKQLRRWYYIDMKTALDEGADREEAIVAVPEDKRVRSNFGKTIDADYRTPQQECAAEVFPLAITFDMGAVFAWQNAYLQNAPELDGAAQRWNRFYTTALKPFVEYKVPVIVLSKDTPKEAVCTVFEKVNTGGVVLNVFELLTATFAVDDFRLNDDWGERRKRLRAQPVLSTLESTDFLQAISLITTYNRRREAIESGTTALPGVSCRRKDILRLALTDYYRFADDAEQGFAWTKEFLAEERILAAKDVPYRTQIVPLAALRAILGGQVDQIAARTKLRQWFWCGILGELYGGAIETRFARDVEEVPAWINGGPTPRTVQDASFEAERLLTMRTRNSAAYKGVYALLMYGGCQDWMKAQSIDLASFFDLHIDIHHVFPRAWCEKNGVDHEQCDSIVNKTPLSYDTNRSIGGRAPSEYVKTIQTKTELPEEAVDALLGEHHIDPATLRADDFDGYFAARRTALLALISEAMGKPVQDVAPEGAATFESTIVDSEQPETLPALEG